MVLVGKCRTLPASRSSTTVASVSEGWRRERDSNPRKPFDFNGFQDRRLKPLGHLSIYVSPGPPAPRLATFTRLRSVPVASERRGPCTPPGDLYSLSLPSGRF